MAAFDPPRHRGTQATFALGFAAFLCVWAFWSLRASNAPFSSPNEGLLMPAYAAQPTALASIFVRSRDQSLTLTRRIDGWSIAERGDFAVKAARVQPFLEWLASARFGRSRTQDPKKHDQLALGDPYEDGLGTLIVLRDVTGKVLGEVVLGTRGDRFFARLPDANQSFDVNSAATSHPEQFLTQTEERDHIDLFSDWLDLSGIAIEPSRIFRLEIAPTGSEAYAIRAVVAEQTNPDGTVQVQPVNPPRFKLADPWSRFALWSPELATETALALSDWTPIDVIPANKIASAASGRRRLQTRDGLVLDTFAYREDGKYWLRFEASALDPVRQAEADALNLRSAGWAYGARRAEWERFVPRLSDLADVSTP